MLLALVGLLGGGSPSAEEVSWQLSHKNSVAARAIYINEMQPGAISQGKSLPPQRRREDPGRQHRGVPSQFAVPALIL